MQGAEDRQRDGETQIAQGYDLVEAAGPCDIGLGSPQGDQKKQDAGAAHRDRGARERKKCGENGCVHADAKRKARALSGHVFRGQYALRLYNDESARIRLSSIILVVLYGNPIPDNS
jgi:hypothetical protein